MQVGDAYTAVPMLHVLVIDLPGRSVDDTLNDVAFAAGALPTSKCHTSVKASSFGRNKGGRPSSAWPPSPGEVW